MRQFIGACIATGCCDSQVGVVSEFQNLVSVMHKMQVSCSDGHVRCWSCSRALQDASNDVGQLRYTSSELSALGVSVEEVLYPLVNR